MKLAIIVTEFPARTETFIARDVATFLERGHEVRLFHLRSFNRGVQVHAFARPVAAVAETRPYLAFGALWRAVRRRPGVVARIAGRIIADCWREPSYMLKSFVVLPKAAAFAESLSAWGADHVHAEFAGHPATAAWIIHRLTGLPYSVSCRAHDIFVTQALLPVKLRESAFVRTISRYNIDFLKARIPGFDADAAVVIRSSVNIDRIAATDVRPGPVFRILYVGSLHSRKGVDTLLRALAGLEGDWQCDLIGDGPERPRLERLAQELGLATRLRFRGAQPFETVAEAFDGCHVVAVPSTYGPRGRTEGIPNVVIESLAYRRPVVTTRISGIPELVEHGKTGLLVEPDDADALRAALRQVRDFPQEAQTMADEGRRAVEREFNLATSVDRQLALFEAHRARQAPVAQ